MRFAVVGCPQCRRVQTVETRHTRIACRGCRGPLEVATLKAFYRGEDDAEARAIALKLTAQREGMGIEDYAQLLQRIDAERTGTIEQVLEALALRQEFDLDVLGAEMRRLHVAGDPEATLGKLVGENRVFEPKPGRFRLL